MKVHKLGFDCTLEGVDIYIYIHIYIFLCQIEKNVTATQVDTQLKGKVNKGKIL
jgi:hypothetical protein